MDFEQRLLNAINELLPVQKGSLWFVLDEIWNRTIPDFIRKRKGHPGLCIGHKKYDSLYAVVPMMLGSSKNAGRDGFKVEAVMPGTGVESTYFHVVRPVILWDSSDASFAVRNFTGENPRIKRNLQKPSLTADEAKRLDEYLDCRRPKI